MKSSNVDNASIHVGVLHPSFGSNLQWIDDFVPEKSSFIFHKVMPPDEKEISWHDRGPITTWREWKHHFSYAKKAVQLDLDIVVTNFPQLAFAACFWKILLRKKMKIISWSFNIGSTSNKNKGRAAGFLLKKADLFIVHSKEEIVRYSDWLGLPESRFMFMPLQHGVVKPELCNVSEQPFLVSLGSAGRDYRTLFAAVEGLDLLVIVIAKPDALEGLEIPSNVKVMNGLSMLECQSIASQAVAGVVPVSNLDTASGQVTFLMLMALGVPVIVTDCPGSRDYLCEEHDALIVPPSDYEALRFSIRRVWADEDLRKHLAQNGLRSWRERFSDEAAGVNLVRAIEQVV